MVDTGNPGVVSRIVHEPVGVCGLITPWNYPLLQVSWKVAPCLAAGNTFVLKPSELTPHTAIHLMKLLDEAGLPAGVANLVLGDGANAGALLSEDPRVDLVSFTGGLATGKRIMATASGTVKKIALELGGKNPNIVFADADFDTALDFALTAVFLHSGQVCSAGARLVVEESLHDRFVDDIVERAQRIRLGGPFDDKAETGPLTSAAHRDKVEAVRRGRPGRGRRAPLRRQASGRPRPRRRLLLPAHRARPVHQRHERHPGRVVRAGAHGRDVHRRGRRRPHRQRQHLRTRGRGLDRRRRQGTAGRGPAPDGHGVDQRLPPVRGPRPSGAATSSPASAASSAMPGSRSTARPSTSGTTSPPSPSTGSRHDERVTGTT